MRELAVIPVPTEKWYDIGNALGISEQLLNDIKKSKLNESKKKLEMYKTFLNSPEATWKKVILAIQKCGEHKAAEETCEAYNLPLTLLQPKLDPKRVVTAPLQLTGVRAQSDSAVKSCSARVESDVVGGEGSVLRHNSSSSSPLAEQGCITKSFVDDVSVNEPSLSLSETVVLGSRHSKLIQTVSLDHGEKMTSGNAPTPQPSSPLPAIAGSPNSESLEFHSFSDNDSGPLSLSELPQYKKPAPASVSVASDASSGGLLRKPDSIDSGNSSATSSLTKASLFNIVQKGADSSPSQLGLAGSGDQPSETTLTAASLQTRESDSSTRDDVNVTSKGDDRLDYKSFSEQVRVHSGDTTKIVSLTSKVGM